MCSILLSDPMDLFPDFEPAEYPTLPLSSNLPLFAPAPTHPPSYPFAYRHPSINSPLQQPEPITIDNTGIALALAFAGNSISTRSNAVNATWQLQCPDCKAWISTSISSSRTIGDRGDFTSLVAHRNGKKCREQRLRVAELRDASHDHTMQLLLRTMSALPDLLSLVKRTEAVWFSQNAHDFDEAYTG